MQCHVRVNGSQVNRVSGNMVYGYFLHRNSRPIDGYSDPQLHIHTVVMNITFDRVENKWKAVEIRDKTENREYYNAIFNSKLALKLQSIGIPVVKRRGDFEIAGINDQTIETFSRRTNEVENEAKSQSIFDDKLKDSLGARTRNRKSDNHTQSELREIYLGLISADQKLVIESLGNRIKTDTQKIESTTQQPNTQLLPSPQALKHLDYTLEKAFERHSSMSEQRLIGEVLKEGVGEISLEQVNMAIVGYKERGILIDELTNPKNTIEIIQSRNNLSPTITTQVALSEEQSIIQAIDSQKRIFNPINTRFEAMLANDTFLNYNQKAVINEILSTRDGITMLEGKAGTGKTTTLKKLEEGLVESNKFNSILVLAPTTQAVEVLKTEGFSTAMTVQKYLSDQQAIARLEPYPGYLNQNSNQTNDPEPLQANKRQYLVIDESSLVSVRQMDKLLKNAIANDQRILLVGDTKQHKSVERGNTLQTIKDHSKIEVYSLNQIQRQKEQDLKQAVELLASGQTVKGIDKLAESGSVKVIPDDQRRLEYLAQIYVQNLPKVYANKVEKLNEKQVNEQIDFTKGKNQEQNQNWLQKMSQSVGQKLFRQDDSKQRKQNQLNEDTHNQGQEKTKTTKIQYEKLTPQNNTLVITPTHLDGQDIHQAIRQRLKAENLIDQQDHNIETLRSLSWTTVEKSKESNYQLGQVLQFSGNIKEYKKGERYEVVESLPELKNKSNITQGGTKQDLFQADNQTNNRFQIKNTRTGEQKEIPTQLNSYFDLFQKESITVSKGDLIHCQRQTIVQDKKGLEHKTTNGATYQIKHISPRTGDITLSNDWILPKDFGNLKSAYYSTSHASQGQTVNHSIFYTSNHSQHLLNQDMVYVANSRFRLSNTILTPNLEQFKQYAQKLDPKSIALEVLEGKKVKNVINTESKSSQEVKPTVEPKKGLEITQNQSPTPKPDENIEQKNQPKVEVAAPKRRMKM